MEIYIYIYDQIAKVEVGMHLMNNFKRIKTTYFEEYNSNNFQLLPVIISKLNTRS